MRIFHVITSVDPNHAGPIDFINRDEVRVRVYVETVRESGAR
jgi:hypothetical protein